MTARFATRRKATGKRVPPKSGTGAAPPSLPVHSRNDAEISHGEPTFFTPKRAFAMFADNHHDDGHVAVCLPAGPGVQENLIEDAPQIYFRPPYVGAAGWIGVELERVEDDWLGSLVREAYH